MDYIYPTLSMNIRSLKNFQDRELATRVINTINEFGKDFLPSKFDRTEPLKSRYNPKDICEVIKVWMNDSLNQEGIKNEYFEGLLLMKATGKSKASYMVNWRKNNIAHFNSFHFTVNIGYAKQDKHLQIFLNLCKTLILLLEPIQGEIVNESFPGAFAGGIDLKIRHPELHWMNFFGKPYMDLFGREKLLSAPAYKVEQFGDNIIAMQTMEDVFSPIPNDLREKIKRHLGENAFVWDGKRYLAYKDKENLVPEFDFSEVLFDKTKPMIVPQPRNRQNPIIKNEGEERKLSDDSLKSIIDDWSSHVFGLAKMYDLELDYSEESIEKIEQLCEIIYQQILQKPDMKEESITKVAQMIGSFLGELMIKNTGGEWVINENKVIAIRQKAFECYPIGKISKRLKNGSEDNIVLYYQVCKKQISLQS